MSGDQQLDPHGRREELERQIANLRVENQRLRNLLKVARALCGTGARFR